MDTGVTSVSGELASFSWGRISMVLIRMRGVISLEEEVLNEIMVIRARSYQHVKDGVI
jgi:hypothetical protein